MVELEVLKPYSTITRESCRLFFDSLSDKSAMMRLENHKKTVAEKGSATLRTEKKDYRVNEPFDNSYMYTYPPGFTPSPATKAFLEEQVPSPRKTYVLPPDIFEKRNKVLPDISSDLQKEMERLIAQNSIGQGKSEIGASAFEKATAPIFKGTSGIAIDRYDEYLRIKKTMQGKIRPAVRPVTKIPIDDTTDKQKTEESSPQVSKPSDFVKGISTTLVSSETNIELQSVMKLSDVRDFSLPRAVQDRREQAQEVHIGKSCGEVVSKNRNRQRQTEGMQQNTSRYIQAKSGKTVGTKGPDESMKHQIEKRHRDIASNGNDGRNDPGSKEPTAKRMKASPVQLSFLEQASLQDFKIPKREVKFAKYLGISHVGLKRKGHDDVETDRRGKRFRSN